MRKEGADRQFPVCLRDQMGHSFSSLSELGDSYGFRKIRQGMGIEAFGVNAVVMPAGYEGFLHYHDQQDELYFVHSGTAKVEVDGESRLLSPGGLFHASATTQRKVGNGGSEDLILLIVGGKGGHIDRDGHLVDPDRDLERRAAFGRGEVAGQEHG